MYRLLTSLCLLMVFQAQAQFQGLVVNEFSQGNGGNREYIELLVVGNRTCTDSTADIRGWIFDDQNGWYGNSNGTPGHYRFKNDPNWASVPYGSIILVYNAADKNSSITLADDPTDANHDYAYIVAIGSSLIEQNLLQPDNNSGPGYTYPAASYATGYTNATNQWQFIIAINNTNGDVISTVSPSNPGSAFFSIAYGYTINPGYQAPVVAIPSVGGGNSAWLSSSGYTVASSWNISSVPTGETPGLPNGGANTSWIQLMRQQVSLTAPLINVTQPSCYSSTGSIIVTSPVGPGLFYSIDGSNYSNSFGVFTGLAAGSYPVTVKNSAGCISPITMAVINPQPSTPMAPTVAVTQPDCNNPTGTINITSPLGTGLLYSIDGINYYSSPVFVNLNPSLYGVTVKNSNGGCTSPSSIITINPSPSVITLNLSTTDLCTGPATVTATASPAASYNYTWTVPAGAVNPGNVSSFTTNTAGIYTVLVSANGCSVSASDTIKAPPVVVADDKSICENQSVQLTGQPSGGSWSGTNVSGGQFLAASPGVYQVYYQIDSNGCTVIDTAMITVAANPPAPVVTVTDHCNNTSTLTASGFSGMLLWSNGASTASINVSTQGIFSVTQTVNGCTSAAAQGTASPLTTPAAPLVSIVHQPDCTDTTGSIQVNSPAPGTGYSYSIDGINYTNVSGSFTGLAAGNYNVRVQNNEGCISLPAAIQMNPAPALPPPPTVSIVQPTCNSADGNISITSPLGTGYLYSIDGQTYQSSPFFNALQPASYAVTVQNSNGCISAATNITIDPPAGVVYHSQTACIQQGQTYQFNGQQLTATGNYSAIFSQPGTCDSVVQLYLLVKFFDTVSLQGCGAVSYQGQTYTASAILSESIPSVVTSCDSIQRTIFIQVGGTVFTDLNVCLQPGQSYFFNGQSLTASGNYTDTLTASQGCDSIIRLSLMVPVSQMQTISNCGPVVYNGTFYTSSTIVYDTVQSNTSNCDSIYHEVHIEISQGSESFLQACIGQGQTYQFNGQLLATSGHYTAIYQQPNLCDSTVHLNLVVTKELTQTITGCGSVLFNGTNYTSSTMVKDTVKSIATGCDSLITTTNILVSQVMNVNQSVCLSAGQTYLFNGTVLSTSGHYTDTLVSAGGCDSIVQLDLVITKNETATYSGCETVMYNGNSYSLSTDISEVIPSSVSGCDSIMRTIHIIVHPKPFIEPIADQVICRGDSIQLTAIAAGASLSWTGFPAGNSIKVSPQSSTDYQVIAINAMGCRDTAYAHIDLHDFNLLLTGPVSPVISGTNCLVQSSSNIGYTVNSWTPASIFPNQQAYSQNFIIDSTLHIVVAARSSDGCADTADITIAVVLADDIYIPDAFTPNADGRNDYFRAMGGGRFKTWHLQVFNRWGELVFSSRDRSAGWNGTSNGKPQATGAYVYLLQAETTSGKKIVKKGTVVLIR